jgi:outer membrane lipoprotein SlyB
MKKILFLLSLLMAIVISGCATEQGSTGGYERPSGGHAGHHH